jgi:DNA-binding transcriptional regulator YdaS (Cro superfamily)
MKTLNTKQVMARLKLNQANFALLIGIKQPSVSYRIKHDLPVTAEEAIKIESSNGLSKHITRPDIFGKKDAA